MRRLSPNERENVESTLLQAFPSEAELARAVKFAVNENLEAIAGNGPLKDVVFRLITWAESRNKLTELISGAHKANSDNKALLALHTTVGAFTDDLPRPLPASELKLRTKYLGELQKDIQERLKVSIHNARFIDIGLTEDPYATHLPWSYRAPDTPEEFANFGEAFQHYKRRLLLLGAPGAGKSTVLLHIARLLVEEAVENPHAPIPLLLNLTQFTTKPAQTAPRWFAKRAKEASPDSDETPAIAHWLARMMVEKYPFINRELADRWVKEARVAALLDGLDEVAAEQRAELVAIINQSYLDPYPFVTVVICSRVIEYHVLRAQSRNQRKEEEAGLHLEAVTLQPLSPQQIADYLEKAQATALHEALLYDNALQELARIPLTLSMMTLAYAGLAPTEMGLGQSLTERRRHLFNLYVDRMMQRKARRDAGLPFDLDPGKDRPTQYSRQQLDRALGWLAVRMSERAQTIVPLKRLYTFLRQKSIVKANNSTSQLVWLTDALVVCLFLFTSGLLLVPFALSQLGLLLLLTMLTGFLYWLGRNAFGDSKETATEDQSRRHWVHSYGLPALALLGFAAVAVVTIGSILVALQAVLPGQLPGLALGVMITVLVVGTIFTIEEFKKTKRRNIYLLVTLTSILVPATLVFFTGAMDRLWAITATFMGIFQGLYFLIAYGWNYAWRRIEWGAVADIFAVGGGLLLAQWLGIWLVGALDWYEAVVTISAALLIAAFADAQSILVGVTVVTLMASPIGTLAVILLWAVIGLSLLLSIRREKFKGAVTPYYSKLDTCIGALLESYLFTPLIQLLLTIQRIFPFHSKALFAFSSEIYLLKPVGTEQEFLHRLLRDYFATHELIPSLSTDDPKKIIQVIIQLSLQGEAAVEILSDLANNSGDPQTRQTAVHGVSYIATPAAAQILETCLNDSATVVRREVVRSASRLTDEDKHSILAKAADDRDLGIRLLALRASNRVYDVFADAKKYPITYETILQELKELLQSTAEDIRTSAVWALGSIGDARTMPDLLKTLRDSNVHVRAATAEAMGKIGDLSILPVLCQAFPDPIPLMRIEVTRTLGRIGDASIVSILLQALRDSDRDVRGAAATALGQVGEASVVPALLQALRDSNRNVRGAAATALGQVGDASVVPALLQALRDSERDVRRAAAEALGQVGDASAVPALLPALRDSDGYVRRAAAEALGQVGDASAVPALLPALRDSDGYVRRAAAGALGQVGDASVVSALLPALRDSDGYVRRAAAEALGQVGDASAVPALLPALRDSEGYVRSAAAEALGQVGDASVVPALLQAFRHSDWDVRRAAAKALGQVGDASAVSALLQALRHSEEYVRSAAAGALGQVGDASVVPALLQALRDSDGYVRGAAAGALGQVGDASVVSALLQALRDSEGYVRSAAAEALGQVGDASVVPALLQAFRHSDWDVRRAAAKALGQVGDASAVPALLPALRDSERDVRRAAAEALGQVGDASVVPALLPALRDSDGYVRRAAAGALGQVGDASVVSALLPALRDSDGYVRRAAAEALGQVGDASAVPALLPALRDSEGYVRSAAAEALGQVGDASVVPALLQAFRHSDWDVRRAAAKALGQVGDASAVSALLQALRHSEEYVRSAAAGALGQVGDASVVPALLQALRDSDEDVRSAAAEALGQVGDERAIQGLATRLRDRAIISGSRQRVCDHAAKALEQIGTAEALQALNDWRQG